MNATFFGELLQSIADRGRSLLARPRRSSGAERSESLVELCEHLLTGRGEASGVAMAREILARYAELRTGPRIAFFEALAERFGPDPERMEAAIAAWRNNPCDETAAEVHAASEPRRQELFRRLNLAPGGTAALVRMRGQLIDVLARRDDDLRRRINPPDRRCFAFFHPALVDDPVIFVEVALTRDIPAAIAPILATEREVIDADKARTAVFYSISNCQRGLAGVSFGNFLIKQVAEEISREMPKLSTFVTLSPVTGFAAWLRRERAEEKSAALTEADKATLATLDDDGWHFNAQTVEAVRDPLMRAAAWYFLRARNGRGVPLDPVARFHLGNGARLERINFLADTSDKAMEQAHGLMVNYLYELDDIEKNHEAYAEGRTVVASGAVQRLLRPPLELVPIAG
jgi:malonyl-CoA decarboxylase